MSAIPHLFPIGANTDKETGIVYGVHLGNKVPWAMEYLCEGEDISFTNYMKEIEDELAEGLRETIIKVFSNRGMQDEVLVAEFVDQARLDLFPEIQEVFSEGYEDDEPQYEQSDGPDDSDEIEFHMISSWLGGALHVMVLKSPRVAFVRTCSPCYPNAGDLDTPSTEEEGGVWAYCLPSEYESEDNENNPLYTETMSLEEWEKRFNGPQDENIAEDDGAPGND